MTREFTGAVQLDGPLSIDNLWFWINTGQGDLSVTDPRLEIQLSNDAGETWEDFDDAPIGATGQYREIPEFRRLGMFDAPGMMVRGRVPHAIPFRLSAAKFNEPLTVFSQAGVPAQLLDNRPDVREAEMRPGAGKLDVEAAKGAV